MTAIRTKPFAGLAVVVGMVLLAAAIVLYAITLEKNLWIAGVGALLSIVGVFGLRAQLSGALSFRRLEILSFAVGALLLIILLVHLSYRFYLRFDLTQTGEHSLSSQSVAMLEKLENPIEIVFFHDALMRETAELYELFARENDAIALTFHDPTIEPARARLLGVRFAGTAVMRSEDREIRVHGGSEIDIANGIIKVSQNLAQELCFLDGHGEADPFSQQAHDHHEGQAGDHSHGIGAEYILHETHGMAKIRGSLETLNYVVSKRSLLSQSQGLDGCSVLVVAGPKHALQESEVATISDYLAKGGHAFLMLEPHVETGLEAILEQYGIVADAVTVIDDASHYWTDASAPAVTNYNNHQITRKLPLSFFPGARSFSPTSDRVQGTRVIPLINTSAKSFGETSKTEPQFDEGSDLPGPRTLAAAVSRSPVTTGGSSSITLGDEKVVDVSHLPTVEALSRLVVIGDVDFATNSFSHILGNGQLFLNAINHLSGEENLIGIEPATHDLPRLSVTNQQIKTTFIVSVLFIPFLLGLIGTIVWWRQR